MRHLTCKIGLAVGMALAAAIATCPALADEPCPNGARVDDLRYCKFIVQYRDGVAPPDARIIDNIHVDDTWNIHSIAIVIGESRYPGLPQGQQVLTAAANDVRKLKNLLTSDAEFDEVIVISDEDVTLDNINYFLKQYLVAAAQKIKRRSRLLFAYSGHGLPSGIPNIPGYLALYGARNASDYGHLLNLNELRDDLYTLSALNFQVLALMNACHGGGMFGLANSGGDENAPDARGGRGVTAGSIDNLVFSRGNEDDGSVFFDAIEQGIITGDADKFPPVIPGVPYHGGLIRLGALQSYLSKQIYILNALTKDHPFSHIWTGSIESPPSVPEGGFFFLSPLGSQDGRIQKGEIEWQSSSPERFIKHANSTLVPPSNSGLSKLHADNVLVAQTDRTAPHVSESKDAQHVQDSSTSAGSTVFKSPSDYPIKGVDLSHYNGDIDWHYLSQLKDKNGIPEFQFAFLKATQGLSFRDPTFKKNWDETASSGIIRGAYHYVDLCADAQKQFVNIKESVPQDPKSLPLMLDVEYHSGEKDKQSVCVEQSGVGEAKERLLTLGKLVEKYYGKAPIIFTAGDAYQDIVKNGFTEFPLWAGKGTLDNWGATTAEKPWVLWQYGSGGLGPLDLDVFYGTSKEFMDLVNGKAR